MNLSNMSLKTKSLSLFILFIILSLGITLLFVIKTAEFHFSKQVEKLLISQADSLSDKLQSFDMVSAELNKYMKKDLENLLYSELRSMEKTAENVATAYSISGESAMAVQFRVLDIIDKKVVGKTGFSFAFEYDGTMAVMPNYKFAKGELSKMDRIISEKGGSLSVIFDRKGLSEVACKNSDRFEMIICVTIPESEASASADFVNDFSRQDFEEFINTSTVARTGYYYLLDMQGNVLMHPDSEIVGQNLSEEKYIRTILSEKSGSIKYDWEGKTKLAGFAHIEPMDAILVGGANINEFLGGIKRDLIIKPVIVGILVIIAASLLMNLLFNKTVVSPIKKLGYLIEKISAGDLTEECRLSYRDEIGTIGRYMDKMTADISGTLSDVKSSALDVKNHSEKLSQSGSQLSDAIKAQSDRTANVESSIQEILSSFDEISDSMQDINSEINQIRNSAQSGQTVLNNTVTGIRNLSETVISTSDTINSLGGSSKQILEIVAVISDIADQTNLLALNAAIEAARAGEHGRGFAVVADEVRKLAERTVTATSEINQMTSGISRDVNKSVEDMQTGAKLAQEGEHLATELEHSLEVIINGVVEAAGRIESVSAAISQQNESSRRISEDSSQIAQFSKNNAEISAGNRQQAEMLNDLAAKLLRTVESFRLKA